MLFASLLELPPCRPGKDRGDLSPQTPQLRQNPGQHTLLAVNLPLLFVARPIGMGPSRVLQLR